MTPLVQMTINQIARLRNECDREILRRFTSDPPHPNSALGKALAEMDKEMSPRARREWP